jgi:hypothetical protein
MTTIGGEEKKSFGKSAEGENFELRNRERELFASAESQPPFAPRRRLLILDAAFFLLVVFLLFLENAVPRIVLSRASRGACFEPRVEPVRWREL